MKEDKKLEKRKNLKIVVLSIIIVALLGLLIYFFLIKKDKNGGNIDNQLKNDTQEAIIEKNVYKTKDGKYTLKIIDEKSYDSIKTKYKNDIEKVSDNELIKGYAFLNNYLLILTYISDDELYASYHAYFPNNVTQFYESFVVDKQSKMIIEKNKSPEDALIRFSSENGWDSHIKTNAGYFLIFSGNLEPNVLYTISGKKLGYVDNDVKSDYLGVYVYNNLNDDFDFFMSTPTRYDVNGNVVAVTKGVYKTSDGKFTLKIIDHNKAYLNDELFILAGIYESEKYVHYHGDFDGEGSQSGYNFLVDKEKGIIVEGDTSDVKDLNDRMLRFYGDGDLSINIDFIKCDAGYFFVDNFAIEGNIVEIYTTSWKMLGYVDIDNIKSDKDGIYVYKDYEPFDKLVGNPTKYDVNGNKIN